MSAARLCVVCADMSSNALGRAMLLGRLAERAGYEVTVAGVAPRGRPIWSPATEERDPIRMSSYPLTHAGRTPAAIRWLARELRGADRVLIAKPVPTSLGLALAAGVARRPALLDIDDWDAGFRRAGRRGRRARLGEALSLLHPTHFNTQLGMEWAEAAARLIPHRVVSNRWLERRFGGAIVHHVRDHDALDPRRVDAAPLRATLRLDDRLWIGFVGTPRPHKGLEILVDAIARSRAPRAPGLILCGCDRSDAYARRSAAHAERRLGSERLRVIERFGFDEIALHVALPDVLAVPSLASDASVGQMPAKLFDAMAMAKPCVASDVNDIAEVLGDTGVVVPAGDAAALADAIDRLDALGPGARSALGEAARARSERLYGFDQAAETLAGAIERSAR